MAWHGHAQDFVVGAEEGWGCCETSYEFTRLSGPVHVPRRRSRVGVVPVGGAVGVLGSGFMGWEGERVSLLGR